MWNISEELVLVKTKQNMQVYTHDNLRTHSLPVPLQETSWVSEEKSIAVLPYYLPHGNHKNTFLTNPLEGDNGQFQTRNHLWSSFYE